MADRAAWLTEADRCVRCAICLPACPTFDLTGREPESPRGRIALILAAGEGEIPWSAAAPSLDRCLGCLACAAACPAGIDYGRLLQEGRAAALHEAERRSPLRGAIARWGRRLALRAIASPRLLRIGAPLGRVARRWAGLLPGPARRALRVLPEGERRPPPLPPRRDPEAARPRTAGCGPGDPGSGPTALLFPGCAQEGLLPRVNGATAALLERAGYRVESPSGLGCCGALAAHRGDLAEARRFARRNLRAFARAIERPGARIVLNSAGCGLFLQEYGRLLPGDPLADRCAGLVQDLAEVLWERLAAGEPAGFPTAEPGSRGPILHHRPCHLEHGQGRGDLPARLLERAGYRVIELRDPGRCCGAAGDYHLRQPGLAGALLDDRVRAVREALAVVGPPPAGGPGGGVEPPLLVATANPGCQLQLAAGLREAGLPVEVRHWVEVLAPWAS